MGEVILAAFVAMVLLPLMLGSFVEKKWLKKVIEAGDQQCPHCDAWPVAHGGWEWVGNSENYMVDFVCMCRVCGCYSDWVWTGPGVCEALERLDKNTAKGR